MELGPLMSGEYEADTILRISHPGETQKIELSLPKMILPIISMIIRILMEPTAVIS